MQRTEYIAFDEDALIEFIEKLVGQIKPLISSEITEVTRLVVVDHRGEEPIGRIIDTMPVKIEASLQDDNRTLKIFITKRLRDKK